MVNANSGDKDIIKEMIKDINLLNQCMTTDINLTAINGITKYLQLKHIDLYKSFKKWSDLNEHLKEIRLSQEPKKYHQTRWKIIVHTSQRIITLK
jgi:hypothetical protein